MIQIKTEQCHFITVRNMECYINEHLPFDNYRIIDEDMYSYGNFYVFKDISGTYNADTEYIKKGIEDGEFFDIVEILNYLVSTGVFPIGTYILDTR